MKGLLTIGLLPLSNTFMTLAWYGHLKFAEWKWFNKLGYGVGAMHLNKRDEHLFNNIKKIEWQALGKCRNYPACSTKA